MRISKIYHSIRYAPVAKTWENIHENFDLQKDSGFWLMSYDFIGQIFANNILIHTKASMQESSKLMV